MYIMLTQLLYSIASDAENSAYRLITGANASLQHLTWSVWH